MNKKKMDEADRFDASTAKLFYLNKDGSKCVRMDANNRRERLPVSFDGGVTVKMVSVMYWEQCGNFAFANVRQRRKPGSNQIKVIAVFPDSEVEPTMWKPHDTAKQNSGSKEV